jgi:hypothetical protein
MEGTDSKRRAESVKAADGTLAPKNVRGFEVNLSFVGQATEVLLSEPGYA